MAFRDIVETNIEVGDRIDRMVPGENIVYANWYDRYDNEKPPENIQGKLRNPALRTEWVVMDAPTFKSKNKPNGPIVAGENRTQLSVGPVQYKKDETYLYRYPHEASLNEMAKFPASLDSAFTDVDNALGYILPLKGPLDLWFAAMYRSDKNNYGKWTVLTHKPQYFNRKSFNYTMDRETSLFKYIRYMKLAPLAGIWSHTDTNWILHMISGLVNLGYWHYMNEIMRLNYISKWEDLPSIQAANDVVLNRVIPGIREQIRAGEDYTNIHKPQEDSRANYVSIYKTTDHYQAQLRKDAIMYTNKHPSELSYSELSPRPHQPSYGMSFVLPGAGYDLQFSSPKSHHNRTIYMPRNLQDLCLKALNRVHDLVLANLEKSIAIQISIEDEIDHEQHEDYGKPDNPFLIYNPSESKAAGKTVYSDISIRPGKQNYSYTSNRIPLAAFKKMPLRMWEMYRRPDASGKLVPQGPPENGKKGGFLPLLALGAAGAYVYLQTKG